MGAVGTARRRKRNRRNEARGRSLLHGCTRRCCMIDACAYDACVACTTEELFHDELFQAEEFFDRCSKWSKSSSTWALIRRALPKSSQSRTLDNLVCFFETGVIGAVWIRWIYFQSSAARRSVGVSPSLSRFCSFFGSWSRRT
eukprot:COSAG02_NODE_1454_length_12536_cov_347.064163_4_plen_143_part_00